MEVLSCVVRGMSNKEIASQLDISIRTVKGHLVSIFAKMNVGSRTEAAFYAMRHGWLTPEDIA
jgi:DNA-binding NarL/FixJ family response regulator